MDLARLLLDKLGEPQVGHRRAARTSSTWRRRRVGPGAEAVAVLEELVQVRGAQGARRRDAASHLRAGGRLAAPRRRSTTSVSRSRRTTASASAILRESAQALGGAGRRSRQGVRRDARGVDARSRGRRRARAAGPARAGDDALGRPGDRVRGRHRQDRWGRPSGSCWPPWPISTTSGATILVERSKHGRALFALDETDCSRSRRWTPSQRSAQRLAVAGQGARPQGRAGPRRRDACEHLAARRRSEARHARGSAGCDRGLRAGARARAVEHVHDGQPHRALRAEERRHAGWSTSTAGGSSSAAEDDED